MTEKIGFLSDAYPDYHSDLKGPKNLKNYVIKFQNPGGLSDDQKQAYGYQDSMELKYITTRPHKVSGVANSLDDHSLVEPAFIQPYEQLHLLKD